MARLIGIDLGTTNSVVAYIEGSNPVIIPNAEGGRLTPSVVAFTKDGEILVGEPAKRQAIINSERTIMSIKRKMGTDFKVEIDGKAYTPEQISAFILRKLKRDAEQYLGEEVRGAVITVPAYFNDLQRQATKDAGRIAGLEVPRIINEPTAAALAYGLDKEGQSRVLVFDFGGGTLDVSILEISEGVFEVIATAGDTSLGGDDIDRKIIDYLADAFLEEHGVDLRKDRVALQRLKEAAEKAKIELSSRTVTEINLPFITMGERGPLHLTYTLTRAKLEELMEDILEKAMEPVERALKDAGLAPSQIDKILLVGGSTRIPKVREMLRDFFGKEPARGVNPDEAVAIGAAIQAGILAGELKKVVLVDVIPLSLGIETYGGLFSKIIERNTPIPISKSRIFTTAFDNQTSVEIHVLQGERALAKDNISLGRFVLEGIPPAPRGVPQIEVTFEVDVDGIVHVRARDLATGKEQKITVTGTTKLSEEEIQRMIREAERYAAEDEKRRREIEFMNDAEHLVYKAKKALSEWGEKIPEELKTSLEEKIGELDRAVRKREIEKIRPLFRLLEEELSKIGESLYKAKVGEKLVLKEQEEKKITVEDLYEAIEG